MKKEKKTCNKKCCKNPIIVCIDGVEECYNCGWYNEKQFKNRYK